MKLLKRATCVAAAGLMSLSAAYGEDGKALHVELPLSLLPSPDAEVKSFKTDFVFFSRAINIHRAASLKEDANFSGDRGTYRVKAGEPLSGVIVIGEWQEGEVKPSWLFNMTDDDPRLAAFLGNKSKKEETEEDKKAREKRRDIRAKLMQKLYNGIQFKEIDVASYGPEDWFYCGEGWFTNRDGKNNKSTICLSDSDGDGRMDKAAIVTFKGTADISIHSISVDEGATVSASFTPLEALPTKYELVSTVQRNKNEYRLVQGFASRGAKKVGPKNMAQFSGQDELLKDGSLETMTFGDAIKVELAEKKRVNVKVEASAEASTVVYPYELKFSDAEE